MTAPAEREQPELHEVLGDLVRERGPLDVPTLAARARRRLHDPGITPTRVEETVGSVTTLVLLPDGRVEHLARVLDGIVLTHRVRGPLAERTDLWLGLGAQPFLTLACLHPLPLVSGGQARIADSGDPALVGPPGWLPQAGRGDLIGLRWREGRLAVARVETAHLAGPREELHVRTLLAERRAQERWFVGRDPDDLAALAVHCLALARLEDPGLLSTPHAPLDEILDDPAIPGTSVLPATLQRELARRALQCGTTVDALVIRLLGPSGTGSERVPGRSARRSSSSRRRGRPRLIVLPGGASRSGDDSTAPDSPEAGPPDPPEAG